jgi:hypothetical protein
MPALPAGPSTAEPEMKQEPARSLWREHDAIKNWITSAAIVLGGIWTSFVFTSLNEVERADAELAALRQEPVANIELTVSEIQLPDQPNQGIVVTAVVQNTGRRRTMLDFSKVSPLTVVRLHTDSTGSVFPDSPQSFNILTVSSEGLAVMTLPIASLLPDEKSRFEFVLPSMDPGLYLLQFSVPAATDEAPATGWHWAARRFYVHCGRDTAGRGTTRAKQC